MKTLYVFFALMTALTVCSDAYAGNEDFEKGLTHYVKRDYRNAEIYFKKYVSQIPDPAGYYLLGYTDYKLKKFHDASRYFTEAYLIDPDISPKAAHLLKKRNKR